MGTSALPIFSLSFFFFFNLFHLCSGVDTITVNQSITDGQTMASANGRFELGFFPPGSSTNRYLGIWYKFYPSAVVWVANRDNPIPNTTGVLKFASIGNLILVNTSGTIFWSPANTTKLVITRLEDSGNFLLMQGEDNSILWQSFDHPTDTLLPGMKLGWDLRTRVEWRLTSWRTTDDPSPGNYSYRIDLHGVPQAVISKGSTLVARAGHWNGLYFTDRPLAMSNRLLNFTFVSNENEIYSDLTVADNSIISRAVLNPSGVLQRFIWKENTNTWDLFWSLPENKCEGYNLCGAYGVCNSDLPFCKCLRGFETKLSDNFNVRDGADRCVRRTALECGKGDGFVKVSTVKLPDTSNSSVDRSLSLDQCRDKCLKNCSCTAYAIADIKENIGCIVWVGKLADIKEFSNGQGQDFYIRLAASELDSAKDASRKKKIVIATAVSVGVLLLLLSGLCVIKQKGIKGALKVSRASDPTEKELQESGCKGKEMLLPFFEFEAIASVTGNFCAENKLGQGGFGPVFKGKLEDGREIAVKRLSKKSHQGLEEFKNEITLIAKLQHRNLVRLLGCCIQGEERMLIYEYMANGSLNSLIFDKTKSACLDWKRRKDIVLGIIRGVLYLHQDSRLRIIHRDLKAGNILLDQEMNPKISDFGTARIFAGDQIKDNTRTVIGTYGYMSPEYVMNGIFSTKSDVFSFGVLVLEIMSGMRSRAIYQSDPPHTLLGYAWRLWNEGNISEFIDETMGLSSPNAEVLKCLHIGLLCVQECAEDRPEMSAVVVMFGSDTVSLPQPKKPGFLTAPCSRRTNSSINRYESGSVGDITVTVLEGR